MRSHREIAGLTQRQLADRAGIGLGALEDLEQGRTARPRRESLARLGAALRLTADQLGELTGASPGTPGNGRSARASKPPGPPGAGLCMAVLGPLTAWSGGLPLDLGPVRQRAVLGLLALHAGTPLPRATIIDALWGEDPPPTSVAMIQAQISQIRRRLRTAAAPGGVSLSWDGAGYRLSRDGLWLDRAEFGALAGRARDAAAAGEAPAACELYERALELWRGRPLEDIEVLYGHPVVTELARQRDAVVIEYADAAAAAGLCGRVTGHLEALAAREPLDERAHARLIIALAATGQQAAALRVYQELAARLDAELGVRPGPELCLAHLRVLRQRVPSAPELPGTAPAVAVTASRTAVARQLPAAPAPFVGRSAEIAALTGLLDQGTGTVAISGTAGAGKTALAVYWAQCVTGRFHDGQLYVNLRGFGPAGAPMAPEAALRLLLECLGAPIGQIPPSTDAQAALYRSLLAGRRVLILLDNARDPEQVRPLLPGTPGCLVLVTSRNQFIGLAASDGARLVALDVLTEEEAAEVRAKLVAQGG
jgi:DNA-binding SARP family transcriptional activator